jgi:hypothetical protein
MPLGYSPPIRDPLTLIRAWCAGRRTSAGQERRIVALLSKDHLLSLPLPLRTRRRAGTTDAEWHRFLWRRHVQHILYWGERREEGNPNGFTHDINWLLRVLLFPDEPGTGEHGDTASGGMSGGAEQGRGTDRGRGAVASRLASATTEVPLCSDEASTGCSPDSYFSTADSTKLTREISSRAHGGTSINRVARPGRRAGHRPCCGDGGGSAHRQSGTVRSASHAYGRASEHSARSAASSGSPTAKRPRQEDSGACGSTR